MIFQNARLIFPDRVERGSLRALSGRIAAIERESISPDAGEEVADLEGKYLAPGFVDGHVHGALRRDAMEADAGAFETICAHHRRGGTTSLALTTVTATAGEIERVLQAVADFKTRTARVLGVHVEGPYFSREKPGAHRLDLIRNPRVEEYGPLLERGGITQMTFAPELPGALGLIDALTARGIIASGGHSDAWDDEAQAAFVRGMRQVTHTFNCMSSARRRGPFRAAGLLEFAMSEPGVQCELIADGRHVSPTLMRLLHRAKGAAGISLVTDATAGSGLAEGEAFKLADIDCVVRGDVGLTADGVALAGSTATMIRCVRNMIEIAGAPLHEAVRMATLNPARMLGIADARGELAVGLDADLVVLSEELEVLETRVAGESDF